jgi:hypothetical protein
MTASSQGIESNDHLADVELRARPIALVEAIDTADDDVRPEPPEITTEGSDSAVGCDEQWKNVEPIDVVVPFTSASASGLFQG